jgi:endogenous inhibitor of DNA gyrase (YacG/DUF329 family)
MPVRIVSCPKCAAQVAWSPASRWRPFCSQRCKMLDLGAWASEAYRVPVESPVDDEDSPVVDPTIPSPGSR